MHTDGGSTDLVEGPALETVRVFLEHGHAPRERMWAHLVAPDLARLSNISRFCAVSVGDVFEVEPFCGCEYEDGMPHYRAVRQVSQGSQRVQLFTRGTSPKRMERVLDYLEAWPAEDPTATYSRPAPGMLTPGVCPCCGLPLGLIAHGMPDDETPCLHWCLAFPLDADEDRIAAFLDGVPFVEFHGLMPEEDE